MKEAYLHIKNLIVHFNSFEGSREILNIDELKINKGEMFGLIGAGGSGKTVLALVLLRLLQMPPGEIVNGEIFIDGEEVLSKPLSEIRNRFRGKKASMVFQDPMSTLNPVFTVEQQISEVIMKNQGFNRKGAYEEAIKFLRLVKLPDPEKLIKKYPHELSGGQRQRVIIALALSCKSDFIIADEPTMNLDATIQASILKLIKELQNKLNVTVLLISNNPGVIYSSCENAAILYKGQIIEKGSVKEVLKESKHPYTHLLLNTIPENKDQKINFDHFQIGESSEELKDSCKYYNLCPQRTNSCKEPQKFYRLTNTHYVRCCLFEKDILNE